nr:transmembrane protein 11, mitochondrial isoform X3 [Caretta caretta]
MSHGPQRGAGPGGGRRPLQRRARSRSGASPSAWTPFPGRLGRGPGPPWRRDICDSSRESPRWRRGEGGALAPAAAAVAVGRAAGWRRMLGEFFQDIVLDPKFSRAGKRARCERLLLLYTCAMSCRVWKLGIKGSSCPPRSVTLCMKSTMGRMLRTSLSTSWSRPWKHSTNI